MRASVVMSVYNAEDTIGEAVESILKQTFTDFEFIIIDDASCDKTVSIIKSFHDSRIKIYFNKRNIGLTRSLNRGLKIAKGEYIIRMDADDVSSVNRLEKQIAFMDQNPEIMLCSCSYITFGQYEAKNIIRLSEKEIKSRLIFGSVLPHPGFIFRSSLIDLGFQYDRSMKYAQDYDFQVRVSHQYKIACMVECLVRYRVSNKQISVSKRDQQAACADRTSARQFLYYGVCIKRNEIEILRKIRDNNLEKLTCRQRMTASFLFFRLIWCVRQRQCAEKREIILLCKEYLHVIYESGPGRMIRWLVG